MINPNTTTIRPVATKADRKAFVELPFRLYAQNPAWEPPLKGEGDGAYQGRQESDFWAWQGAAFLAERDGKVVERIRHWSTMLA